jgi:hypothetical protein
MTRKPQYLSPSSLATWEYSQEEYYLKYLADNPPPKMPQTEAMSVGSSFDAYVKSYCFTHLFGSASGGPFELDAIFETQVEEENRDFAFEAGKIIFDAYKSSGALADLLIELEQASGEPRFEFTVNRVIDNVPILGKPDVWYIHKDGLPIILDFKVNGYCGSSKTYPARGYVRIRPGGEQHKKCQPMVVSGIKINIAEFFEAINKSWAQQLATYAWLCGASVGSNFIVAVDQVVCNKQRAEGITFAEHRGQISEDFQHSVFTKYKQLWEIIHSDHIFRDRSVSESKARCDMLDMQYAAFTDGDSFIKDLALTNPRKYR